MVQHLQNKISIIVPVYHSEQYLETCINSLTKQTYANLEIILIDDNSPDACPQICDRYAKMDPRIIVIHKQQNEGVSKARNTGMDAATGEYIGFVDSDDYIDEQMYEVLLKLCEQYNAKLSTIRFDEIKNDSLENTNEDGKVYCLSSNEYLRNIAFPNMEYRITPSVWTNLYSKDLVKDIKFHEDRQIAEDMIFNCEAVIKAKECIYCDRSLYHYRRREDSTIGRELEDLAAFKMRLLPLFEEELNLLSIYGCSAQQYFRCSYYNSIIPLVSETLSQEENKKVNSFLKQNHLSFARIISMKMPKKLKIESIKKHTLRGLYIPLKKLKAKLKDR